MLPGMPLGCYRHAMANLQVKNVPEALHRKIRAFAKRRGRTVRDVVLEAVTREIGREDFRTRLAKRAPIDLGRSAAEVLEEVRAERARDLGA
jgi:plasmid stability protein